MKAAQLHEAGGPEQLYIGEVPIPEPGENQVLIKVYATAINRADTLQRKGAYAPPPGASDILGLEAVGIVDKLGTGAQKWNIGDRVMALLSGGGYAEYATVHEDHVIPIPKNMPFTQAAAVPEVWLTAFQIIHTVGHFETGDRVLIHAGGSGVGTAAVQLVKAAGGVAIVTAGTQDKINMALSLGAAAGFNYKEGDFAPKVKEFTKGQGVNMILDCVGGSYWKQNAEVIALDGRWVLYGTMGGLQVEGPLLGTILRKRVSLLGSTLRTRPVQYKTKLVKDFTKTALPLFESGKFKTIIDQVFPLEQIEEAHRRMDENKNTGKIIIKVRQETVHQEL